MAHAVEYKINIFGNGVNYLGNLTNSAKTAVSWFDKISGQAAKIANIGFAYKSIAGVIGKANAAVAGAVQAYNSQMVAERQLEQVMRNTMGASALEVQGIKDLASAQQKLGVVGDEVQLAGAKELATYLTKTKSLKQLMPMMNDMLTHQYGLSASQEQAVDIAQMVGKVLDGQTGALSRAGYRFDEAQEKVLKFGREEEKVALLTKLVGQYVGGMNARLAATPEGKLKQYANDAGDLQERIGGLVVAVKSALLPVRNAVSGTMDRVITFFETHRQQMVSIFSAISNVITGAMNKVIAVFEALYNIVRKTYPALLAVAGAILLNNIYTKVANGLRVIAIATTNLLRIARMRENAATVQGTRVLRHIWAARPPRWTPCRNSLPLWATTPPLQARS